MNTDRLYYLTQDLDRCGHLDQVRTAVDAGIRWIQLRSKRCDRNELLRIAGEAVKVARSGNSRLIINDDAAIALESGADGVHLGREDMAVEDARGMLGKKAIIGGTANTWQEALSLSRAGVDYIGLGPFRFTRTKNRLAPILGLDGLEEVVRALHRYNSAVPVFAIGGITEADVVPILETGVYGIAVSSAVNLSEDRETAIVKMLELTGGFESAGAGHNINQ